MKSTVRTFDQTYDEIMIAHEALPLLHVMNYLHGEGLIGSFTIEEVFSTYCTDNVRITELATMAIDHYVDHNECPVDSGALPSVYKDMIHLLSK